MCFETRRAYPENVGDKYKVLWNEENMVDLGKEAVYKKGSIETVYDCGGFCLRFDDGSSMVCVAEKYGSRVNPFKNLIRID